MSRVGKTGSKETLFLWWELLNLFLLFVYDNFTQSFDCKGRILKVDGRLPHRVRKTPDFDGNRFAVIWYKSYDARITAPTPILANPQFVYQQG